VLLLIGYVAGLQYCWGIAHDQLEEYYAAAARSMSLNLHNFLFAAFDPSGTVTVDKLPGALWIQSLSLRIFGVHTWAVALPQAIEGIITVFVLYRAVRRLGGHVAGIVAATILAVSPVTVATDRGNVSESLFVLLLVLALDAGSKAVAERSGRALLLAALWLGLAFQAKMLLAWLAFPAVAVAYLAAAPGGLARRMGRLVPAALLTVGVSLSWMTVVSVVPSHDRPIVDGSRSDSVFSQVFEYDGLDRIGSDASHLTPAPFLTALQSGLPYYHSTWDVAPSWHRLLSGTFGRDGGWLLPASAMCAAAVWLLRRGRGRSDPLRAAALLWGTLFIVFFLMFSYSHNAHAYYEAALSPAVAALCGIAVAALWAQPSWSSSVRVVVAALVAGTVAFEAYLLQGAIDAPGWLFPTLVGCGLLALGALAWRPHKGGLPVRGVVVFGLGAMLLAPAAASFSVVSRHMGPFDSPFEPAAALAATHRSDARDSEEYVRLLHRLLTALGGRGPIVLTTYTSDLAAPYIFYTGSEVFPIGGYSGDLSSPSLADLKRKIAQKDLGYVLVPVSPRSTDSRVVWLESHCLAPHQPTTPGVALEPFLCLT